MAEGCGRVFHVFCTSTQATGNAQVACVEPAKPRLGAGSEKRVDPKRIVRINTARIGFAQETIRNCQGFISPVDLPTKKPSIREWGEG